MAKAVYDRSFELVLFGPVLCTLNFPVPHLELVVDPGRWLPPLGTGFFKRKVAPTPPVNKEVLYSAETEMPSITR